MDQINCKKLPVNFAKFRNAKQAKICDDHFAIFEENVLCFEVFVDDTSGVQVAHTL